MSVLSDFREFIKRGNVVDLAVAVVLGLAFGKVVTSFVSDVLMPPIGMALGGTSFSNLFVALNGASYPTIDAARAAGAPVLAYGSFIDTLIQFLIIAAAVFAVVQVANRLMRKQVAKLAPCPYCTTDVNVNATRCPACTSELQPQISATFLPGSAAVTDQTIK